MNQREKALLGVIVGIAALWGLWKGYSAYESGYDRRVAAVRRMDDELFDQQMEARRAREALQRLETYQQQSLPTDPDVARSVYSAWLIETIQDSGLELASVKWASTRPYQDAATALTFTAGASGPPEAVARWLDAYHRLDVIHQLTNLQLRPADEDGGTWNLSLTSVAMVVAGADREGGLPEEPRSPSRLRLDAADDYAASFAGRNLFAAYTPPPPPKPERTEVVRAAPKPKPSPPPFDDAEHASLSGIVGTGERLEAWVVVRTTGETLRLHDGDPLDVGLLKGKVLSVNPDEIVVEAEDGFSWSATLGDKLREAEQAARKAGA